MKRFLRHYLPWLLAIGVVLMLLVVGIAAPLVAHAQERQTQTVAGTLLRYPRYLKNPEVKELGPGSSVIFQRTTDDTCGLYTWGEFTVAPGQGAPPHLHYGDEEWFIPTRPGQIRMFAAKQGPKRFANGQLPGFNTPPESMGSLTINQGDVMYSPVGNVHYYTNDNAQTISGFLNIWAPGFGIRQMFDSYTREDFRLDLNTKDKQLNQQQRQTLLEKTGLWGAPQDVSGQMVGSRDFKAITGAVPPNPNQLKHLQQLIDAGERCYPKDGRRPE